MESFVRSLYELVEHCDFRTIRDQQIRDRIVIGISDKTVSQKLQLKSNLTLETAIQIARQSELVKSQVTDQSSYVPNDLDEVHTKDEISTFPGKESKSKERGFLRKARPNEVWKMWSPPHKTRILLSKREKVLQIRKGGSLCGRMLVQVSE